MMKTAMLMRVIIPAVPHCNDCKSWAQSSMGVTCYLHSIYQSTIMDDNGDPINNDLHQELDFKNPKDKNTEE
jgi:hypothetical protein